MIRLLLADDQALVRGALAALLDLESDLEVVAQVGRGDEVVEAARSSYAEVCLLDIEMPGLTCIDAAAALTGLYGRTAAIDAGNIRSVREEDTGGFVQGNFKGEIGGPILDGPQQRRRSDGQAQVP